jgi:hypothetical protein
MINTQQQNKSELQSLLNDLSYNMFTLKNINYFCKHNQSNHIITKNNKLNENEENKNKNKNNNKNYATNIDTNIDINKNKNNIYKVSQKDSLFWSFYILKYGLIEYETHMLNSLYILEKKEKLNYINIIRQNKHLLKLHKVKLINEIEDDLANSEIISLKTFFILCLIENINVLLVDNRKYYEIINNEINNNDNSTINISNIDISNNIITKDDNIIKTNILYKNNDSNEYIIESNIDINNSKILFYRNNYLYVNCFDNKLKSISSYKLDELLEICRKLNITTINENMKRKTKKELYEMIVLNFR